MKNTLLQKSEYLKTIKGVLNKAFLKCNRGSIYKNKKNLDIKKLKSTRTRFTKYLFSVVAKIDNEI